MRIAIHILATLALSGPAICSTSVPQESSNAKMAKRLADIATNTNVEQNRYVNQRRLEQLVDRYKKGDHRGRPLELLMEIATEQIRAGLSKEGIATLAHVQLVMKKNRITPDARQRSMMRYFMATGYLRLAEQTNCVAHHGYDSCLMPIRGSGIHTDKRASRAAIKVLAEELVEFPRSSWNSQGPSPRAGY